MDRVIDMFLKCCCCWCHPAPTKSFSHNKPKISINCACFSSTVDDRDDEGKKEDESTSYESACG